MSKNIPLSQNELTTLINESENKFRFSDPLKSIEIAFGRLVQRSLCVKKICGL